MTTREIQDIRRQVDEKIYLLEQVRMSLVVAEYFSKDRIVEEVVEEFVERAKEQYSQQRDIYIW